MAFCALGVFIATSVVTAQDRGEPWVRHAIDDTSQGADGVRMADVNGDGLLDIATAWEEGSVIRVYVNPGYGSATGTWEAVDVGVVSDGEDAMFVDLDDDGAMDVVSCAEGTTRGVFVHWAPIAPADYLDSSQWSTAEIPSSSGLAWMFAVAMDVDGENGIDLVAGAKWGGKIGWFESPATNRRNLSQWSFHEMSNVGWTMSLISNDLDNDGDLDVVVTDRFDDAGLQGARWLENPGEGLPAQYNPWPDHLIGADGEEVMLSTMQDLDEDGLTDLIVPIRVPGSFSFFQRSDPVQVTWQEYSIAVPTGVGTPKAVEVGDIDLDGQPDLVTSYANVPLGDSGVVWMSYKTSPMDPVWQDHEVSGSEGSKYDLVALVDLDNDEDLDIITTEEKWSEVGLGLIWYENPTRRPIPGDSDGDRDVDQTDFGRLQTCLGGVPGVPAELPCIPFLLDSNEHVDQADVVIFRKCMTGENIEGDPSCAD